MAKILCLSDIHFRESDSKSVYGDKINKEFTDSIGVSKLDILFSAMEEIGPIDLLVLCGDYVVGKEEKKEKEKSLDAFLTFLKRVEKSEQIFNSDIKEPKDYILVVPGNHDVNKDEEEILDNFKRKLNRYLTPFRQKVKGQKYAPIFVYDEFKLIVACESTVDNSATINTEIEQLLTEFKNNDLNDEIKEKATEILKKYLLYDIPSITETTKTDFLNKNKKLTKSGDYNDYIKMVVSHHPLMDGIETASAVKKYKGTIGGYSFMRSAMNFGYQLFVHGHIHERTCVEIIDHNDEQKMPVIQLGVPMLNTDSDRCGAILIDTDFLEGKRFPFALSFLKLDSVGRMFKETSILYDEGTKHGTAILQGNKILVDRDIEKLINDKKILKNGDLRNVEAASYDCALGYEYKRSNEKYCDWSKIRVEKLLEDSEGPSKIEIMPNETVLIYTYEEFDIPNDMVLHASPISSWLRRGIRVDLSYFVDPGFKGKFCFPVTNESQNVVEINSREPIVSIEFVKLSESCTKNWSDRHADKLKARTGFED